ncbi:MAG: hypothetical protein ACON4M_04735 [Crocinitomicaceae bacterium]
MKYSKIYIIFLFLAILTSCSQTETNSEVIEIETDDTTQVEVVKEDITPEQAVVEAIKKDKSVDVDFKENKKEIEKVFGEQWDFCHCVVVNDSIDKAVKSGNFDDKLMERFDEVEVKCKSFLVMDNSRTPEERMLHEKKIKNCLRDAGLK